MKKAIGYARKSIFKKNDYSIPGQVNDIQNYANRNNLDLVHTFIDNGQSAFNFQRKEWKELETFIKKHRDIEYLVVYSMDRFSRGELVDSLTKLAEIQKRIGVKVLTVNEPVDLDIEDFGTELRRIVELLLANQELKKIRKRTSDGMYTAMASGRWVSRAPYGYSNTRDEDGRPVLQVDHDKAFFVRSIFRQYLNGSQLEEISKGAKANGLKLKGNSAIRRLLENPLYAGLIQLPKHGTMPARIIKAIHAPIIAESDFWTVQERLQNKTRATQSNESVYLKGSLRCACGQMLSSDKAKGKSGKYYQYYICKNDRRNLSALKLHAQMDEILFEISLPKELVEKTVAEMKGLAGEKMKNKGGDIMRVKLSLQKITDKIDAVQEKFLLQPDISEKVYRKTIGELKTEETRLIKELTDLSADNKDYGDIIDAFLPRLQDVKNLFHKLPLATKTNFLKLVFGHNLRYEDGVFRTPFLHPLFAHSALKIKQKKLLIIEQLSGELPLVALPGADSNNLMADIELLASMIA